MVYIKKALQVSVMVLACLGCEKRTEYEYSSDPKIALKGEKVFKTYCVSCHDLSMNGIGPSLGQVTKSVDGEWLVKFIRNPSAMIDSGDERARRLFNQYNAYMPSFSFLSDNQIHEVLSYLNLNASEASANSSEAILGATSIILPKGDPMTDGNLTLLLEDFAAIPPSSEGPPLARIANMRVRPGSADDEFYVNDQRGYIYFVKGGRVSRFFDIHDYVDAFIERPGIGTGLGSFAFHPDFENNGLLYITHAEEYKGLQGENSLGDSVKVRMQWVLSEWKMEGSSHEKFEGSRRELLRINFPTHAHGFQDLSFVKGVAKGHPEYGLLYLGIGDGGTAEAGFLQLSHNVKSPFGTIFRIDPLGSNSRNGQYGIPASNPFRSSKEPGVFEEIWAYGFRNPHRLEWTSEGELIAADVGQHSFEELNLVMPGRDYGWYDREGTHQIDAKRIRAAYSVEDYGERYELPLAQYDHYTGSAICGGHVYSGKVEALRHKYFFGDIVNGKIFYIKVPFERQSLNPIYSVQLSYKGSNLNMMEITGNGRVDLRFGEDKNKELYIITKSDSKIRKVVGIKE